MRQPFIRFLLAGITVFVLGMGQAMAAGTGPYRFHSPSGRYDILMQSLPDDWTSVRKAQAGAAKESMKQYAMDLYAAKSTEPVNSIVYSDVNPPMPPEDLVRSMQWSPNEEFVLLADKQKAREHHHVFQLAASLTTNKVWSLEADHTQWIDDHRFVGDLLTKEIPGAVLQFDGTVGKAEILIQPENGIGYQIAAVTGHRVTVKEILNDRGTGRTAWEQFTPACFELDLDSLKKRSIACPTSAAGG